MSLVSILAPNRRPVSRYQPRGREMPPLPPRWGPPGLRGDARRYEVSLWRFVFLSMLIHALAILLFGAPPGGNREGRALWGSLDVVIRDSFRDAAPALKIEPSLGTAAPKPAPRAAPPKPPAPAVVKPPRVETPPPVPVPRMLDRLERPVDVPEFKVPKATQIAPPREGRIEVAPLEAAPLEPLAAPAPQRELAEPPKIEAPLAAPKPIEAVPIDRIPAPRVERQLAEPPKIEAPLVQPTPPVEAAPMDRVVAPRVERQLAEPPRIEAPIVQPVPTPALPAPRKEAVPVPPPAAPRPTETLPAEQAPPAPAPAPAPVPAQPQERLTAPTTPSQRATPSAAPPAREVAPSIERESTPGDQAPSPFRAAPSRPGDAPSSTYDPTKPALDVDALRKRAAALTRQGTGNRALLPFPMPPVEKPKSKMEQAIENARKPDCRTAYKELGLAAVIPLVANEFGEGTCRW